MFQPPEGTAPQEVQPRMVLLRKKVDALARNHEFSKARQLLLNEKAEREEGPETELLDRALNNIEEAETAYEESAKIKETYLKQTYESAKRLYEKEDYKGAIATLEALGKTQKLNAEAADLKGRAIESLINRERNRAAELFLEAKKTKDPKKKRALLETSYKILRTLVEGYPQSPLKHKLTSHMNIVQREIRKL
jgi:outer membrane protein assembly factor BamD (BamD/ComL family)